jgi:hypothetical protein
VSTIAITLTNLASVDFLFYHQPREISIFLVKKKENEGEREKKNCFLRMRDHEEGEEED